MNMLAIAALLIALVALAQRTPPHHQEEQEEREFINRLYACVPRLVACQTLLSSERSVHGGASADVLEDVAKRLVRICRELLEVIGRAEDCDGRRKTMDILYAIMNLVCTCQALLSIEHSEHGGASADVLEDIAKRLEIVCRELLEVIEGVEFSTGKEKE